MVEINETEKKKEKRIKRNEDSLRDLWDNAKSLYFNGSGYGHPNVSTSDPGLVVMGRREAGILCSGLY